MRDFITRMADRLSERWNDPEHREDRLAVTLIGVAAAVVIIALLLVLWGYLEHGGGAEDTVSANTLQTATYEEKLREYMSGNEKQAALWREYAVRVDSLSDEVEKLLEAMEQTKQGLAETIEQYRDGDTLIRKELTLVHTQIDSIVQELKETQTQLYDLTDIVQIMSEETLPIIQEQLAQFESDMEKAQADIADLYLRIDALEQEDVRLWESIGDVKTVIESMSMQTLRYRYDGEKNTLYLDPYQG